jgi:hypothetical protein
MAYFAVYIIFKDIEWRQMHSDIRLDFKHKIENFNQGYIRQTNNRRSLAAETLLQLSSSKIFIPSAGMVSFKGNFSLTVEA